MREATCRNTRLAVLVVLPPMVSTVMKASLKGAFTLILE